MLSNNLRMKATSHEEGESKHHEREKGDEQEKCKICRTHEMKINFQVE